MATTSGSLVSADARTFGAFSVGPLGFGCWRMTDSGDIGLAKQQAIIEAALDVGMNLIDTADVYGYGGAGFGANEVVLGQVLAASPGLRERMVLTTKGGITPPMPYNSSYEYLISACEDSLRRLQVESVDLYQIHRPDLYTHPEEVARALITLRESGKIGEVGVSNFVTHQTDALAKFLPFPIATDQPQFSLTCLAPMRDGTLDRCMREGAVPLAWSPLAAGSLATGEGVSAELLAVIDGLAEREGVSRSAIALAFVLAHPSRPVALVGSQKAERLADATTALTVQLDRNDVYALFQASEGVPLP